MLTIPPVDALVTLVVQISHYQILVRRNIEILNFDYRALKAACFYSCFLS